MKKYILLMISFFLAVYIFAKPKSQPVPEWFQNYRTVYPNKEYLAQRGSGSSAEEARTDAMSALARYFQTMVNANLTTSYESITAGENIQESMMVLDERTVTSQVDFFGVEYTENYFYKPENRWYCVAYIYREDAWIQFRPQIDGAKSVFYGFYDKAQKEEEPILRCGLYSSAWEKGKDFLEKLEYGRIISPSEEEKYEKDRRTLGEVPSLIQREINNSSIYIIISGDYSGIVETAVKTSLSEMGFTTGECGNYTAKVSVEANAAGNDPIAIYPGFEMEISGKSGKAVYSFKYKSSEKTVSYTLEGAQKKAYPKFAEQVGKLLTQDMGRVLNIK